MSFHISKKIGELKHKLEFLESEKMMLDRSCGENLGRPDALARTSTAWLAYGDKLIFEGIKFCFRWYEGFGIKGYQASRSSNRYDEDTVSRDQVINVVYAIKARGEKESNEWLQEILKHNKFRISRRFTWTLDNWFFLKHMQGKKPFPIWLIYILFTIPFTELLYKYILKHVDKFLNKKQIKLHNDIDLTDLVRLPMYTIHGMCWQIFLSESYGGLKELTQNFVLRFIEKSNFMLRILLNDKTLTEYEVINYKPCNTEPWALRDANRIPREFNAFLYDLPSGEVGFNNIDRDSLLFMWKKYMKLII